MTTAPRGTYDIMPERALVWQWMETTIRQVLLSYGYGEIRTPIFEHTELFRRGIGETTDIVEKEMYTFSDLGGEVSPCVQRGPLRSCALILNINFMERPRSQNYFI